MNFHSGELAGAPIHSIEVEQQLLGAILMNNQAYGAVAGLIGADHFFEPAHQQIFRVASEEIVAGRVATPVTLKAMLPDVEIHGMPVGRYLAALAANSTTIINAPDFAKYVFEFWQLRQLSQIGATASRPGLSPTQSLAAAWAQLDALRSEGSNDPAQHNTIGGFARILAEEISAPPSADQIVPSTGFTDLDKFIGGGYRPGRLYLAAGRPGMGKTVFGIASARRVALKGFGVAFFSLEIDGKEMSARTIASHMALGSTKVDYSAILANKLSEHERSCVLDASARMDALPMEVDVTGGLSMFEIESRSRVYVERWRRRGIAPGLIVIDYMGLVKASDRYRGHKVHEQGEIAWAGKQLAKKLGVGVLMLAQLNRNVESRDDKRPQMSDLRDSGNIEEHADVVMLLFRPAYYDDRDPSVRDGDPVAVQRADHRKSDLVVDLGKNRLGPTIGVTLWCSVGHCAVDNARAAY